MNYTLPTTVNIDGVDYPIRSDFRVILELMEALNDAELTNEEKAECLIVMFYPDGCGTNAQKAVDACLEFIDMGKSDKHKPKPRLMDWERDFNYIISPVNRVLGFEARSVDYLHWWTFLSAYMEIGSKCLMAQIIDLRAKLASGKKLEKHEREWLRKNQELVVLPTRYTEADEEMIKHWTVK